MKRSVAGRLLWGGLQSLWARRAARWSVAGLGVLIALAWALDCAFPLPPQAFSGSTSAGIFVVLAEDGTSLRSWPSPDGALRQPTTLDAVSPLYLEALQSYEDRWFHWHVGVNPLALLRAGWQWATQGHIVSGGSTLTMQVARILQPASNSRSLNGKLKQIARALQLEWHLSKDDILTLYIHHAPMGGPVEGVEMASRSYLGKSARDLSHAEAALLVALPQMPSRLRPDRASDRAQAARDKVLKRMQTLGVWSPDTVEQALMERVFAPPMRARWLAPLAAERLRAEQMRSGPKGVSSIRSSLEPAVQIRLEQILLDRLPSLPEPVSMAALVVENANLAVRGYAGSADFQDASRSAHVDMVRAVRSPGSTLKPFLYAMALDEAWVHSESLLIDAPQNFGGYAPGNFQAAFSGPVSVSEALQRSLNVPAVDLLERLGPERFTALLRNAGLKLRMQRGASPNLSLILGGAGTTLEELVGAYTALAREGVAGRPRLSPDQPLIETRLMSPGAAFIVREILENGGQPDAPFRESSRRVAWKTGTSFGFRDAWAIGVTDRYTVGVWVGRPDGTPNPGYFGANTAAPLVKDLLAGLGHSTMKPRTIPSSVQAMDICWPLGGAAEQTEPKHCRIRRSAWVLDATAPPTLSDRVRSGGLLDTAWVSSGATSHRWRPGCQPKEGARLESYARWPTLLEPWIDAQWRSDLERLPFAGPCIALAAEGALRISGIDRDSVLRPAPGHLSLSLEVRAVGSREAVTWLLDGAVVGRTTHDAPRLRLVLSQPGPHALTALDDAGRFERVTFSLKPS